MQDKKEVTLLNQMNTCKYAFVYMSVSVCRHLILSTFYFYFKGIYVAVTLSAFCYLSSNDEI